MGHVRGLLPPLHDRRDLRHEQLVVPLMARLEFTAHGVPITQGSVKSYPVKGGKGVRTVSKTPPLIEWREIVREAAERAMREAGLETQDGSAIIRLRFYLPRPKNAPKTVDIKPMRGKDMDKLERAVYDAITNAGVWTDDSRVCDAIITKRFCVGPDLPRIYDPVHHRVSPRVEALITWPVGD